MTIDEAIKTIKNNLLPAPKPYDEALQLGIEALELYYALRGRTAIDVEDIPSRLPSETGGTE